MRLITQQQDSLLAAGNTGYRSHIIHDSAWNTWMSHKQTLWLMPGLVLFLGACWFMAHPYMGIWHDARLYAVDALARLRPGIYDRDLFLEFGSQGKFTLFPSIFAALISWLGLDNAALELALIGKLVWFISLVALAHRMERSWSWLLGLLIVLAYPTYYDSYKVFSYGESFATPRIYAEALSMLALVAWLNAKPVLAWSLVVFSGLLHPLMAIPIAGLMGLLTVYTLRHSARAMWLMAAGVVCTGLILLLIPDLHERVASTYDTAWLEALRLRNPYVFLDKWSNATFGHMAWIGLVLGLCAFRIQSAIARVAGATLVAATGLVLLAWLGASVWDNVLLTQLQLWRALWLAQLLALLLLGGLLPRLWRADFSDRVLAASLVAALLAHGWNSVLISVASIILGQVLRRVAPRIDTASFPWKILPFLIVLPGAVSYLLSIPYFIISNGFFYDKPYWRTLASDGAVPLALAAACYWVAFKGGIRTEKWLASLGATALLVALMTWNTFDPELPRINLKPTFPQLRDRIPPGSVIAAPISGSPGIIWFGLKRASYVSQLQTAGSLFNRDTALEGLRRLKRMQAAGFPNSSIIWRNKYQVQSTTHSVQSVIDLCTDDGLDFVLLSGQWEGAEQYSTQGRVVLSLYACQDLRRHNMLPQL